MALSGWFIQGWLWDVFSEMVRGSVQRFVHLASRTAHRMDTHTHTLSLAFGGHSSGDRRDRAGREDAVPYSCMNCELISGSCFGSTSRWPSIRPLFRPAFSSFEPGPFVELELELLLDRFGCRCAGIWPLPACRPDWPYIALIDNS